MGSQPSTSHQHERGAVLVFLALSLIPLLLVAALAIDGAAAYSQRRQVQNAADAAAMAGAAAVDDVRFVAGTPISAVEDAVDLIAAENGADAWTCELVDGTGARLGDCTDAAALAVAQGVRVLPSDVRPTTFGAIAGPDEVTATAVATATIQPIVGGRAPFAICSAGPGGRYDLLGPDGRIDPAKAIARGKLAIVAAQIYKDDATCAAIGGGGGGAASFKGKIDEELIVIGEEVIAGADPGNGALSYETVQCPEPLTTSDCLLLPMVSETVGTGNNAQMTVVDWSFWRVTETGPGIDDPQGSVRLWGTYVAAAGPSSVPGGVPGSGPVGGGGVRTVSLIE